MSVLTGTGIYVYLYYSESGLLPGIEALPYIISIIAPCSLIMSYLLTSLSRFLTRMISWQKYMGVRFFLGLILNMIILYFALVAIFESLKLSDSIWMPLFEVMQSDELGLKLVTLLFVLVFVHSIFDMTIFSYRQYASGQIESVKLARRQYQLQFEALKSQLSPHYLFNCFNTISSLIYTNPEDAEIFIRKLVQTYQYILNTRDERLVSLSRELEFVRAYNYLLKIRYPDELFIHVDIPENVLDTQIPPLALQMLIENAVKHNDLSDQNPLNIKIHLDKQHLLTVSNTRHEKRLKEHSFNIGIDNIKKRYGFFTERSIEIINGELFKVCLPLLNSQKERHEKGIYA